MEHERFRNRDLHRLDDLKLWQEQQTAEAALAQVRRPTLILYDGTTDVGWLLSRLAAINAEKERRS